MKRIVYKNLDNSIGIITPTDEALNFATLIQVAEKDVPSPYEYPTKLEKVVKTREQEVYNELEKTTEVLVIEYTEDIPIEWSEYHTPYWIVEDSVIPTDRTFRSAWEIDESFGKPDGFGGENNQFDEELLKAYYGGLDDSNK